MEGPPSLRPSPAPAARGTPIGVPESVPSTVYGYNVGSEGGDGAGMRFINDSENAE